MRWNATTHDLCLSEDEDEHREDQQDQEGYVQDTVGVRDAMQKWFCIPRSKVKLSAAVPGCSHLWSILGYC